AVTLATTLAEQRELADLFRNLATLRIDPDVGTVDAWQWRGATDDLAAWATRLDAPRLVTRAEKLAESRRS
ncbi:MAG: flap endonuclease, partial [Acidimicrobiia bacterium]